MTLDELTAKWKRGALVFLMYADGSTMCRPAVFVFLTADGIGWIEPSYANPGQQGSPALHTFTSEVKITESAALFEADGKEGILEEDDGLQTGASESNAWFFDVYLPSTGRTFEEERTRVFADLISDDATPLNPVV